MKTSYQTPEMTFTRLLSEDILTSSTTPSNRPGVGFADDPYGEGDYSDTTVSKKQKRRLP